MRTHRLSARIVWASWLAASIGIGCLTALGCSDLGPVAPSHITQPAAPYIPPDVASDYPIVPLPPKCPPQRICAT